MPPPRPGQAPISSSSQAMAGDWAPEVIGCGGDWRCWRFWLACGSCGRIDGCRLMIVDCRSDWLYRPLRCGRAVVHSACPSWLERALDLVDKTSLPTRRFEARRSGGGRHPPSAAKTKPFANRQSSVAIHQSNRESCEQTRNARFDTGRKIQTLRQSAIISRHSSIQTPEPQANQKRPHRQTPLQPTPSTHQQWLPASGGGWKLVPCVKGLPQELRRALRPSLAPSGASSQLA